MKTAHAPPLPIDVAAPKKRASKAVGVKADSASRATQNTFERIQAAALWLFAVKGVDSSSIREIGARAKVPTSLLYHYAPSKLELLYELMDDGIKRHLNSCREARNLGTTAESQLTALVVAHVHMHGKNRLMARVVYNEWRALPKKQQAKIAALHDETSALWDTVIARGIEDKTFDVKDAKLTRLALIEMCSGVSRWFSSTGPASIETLATDFADLALSMVRAKRNGQAVRVENISDFKIDDIAKLVIAQHVGAVRETRL